MPKTISKTQHKIDSEKRMGAFTEAITKGVSADYLKHLKKEAKENRIIEKYL